MGAGGITPEAFKYQLKRLITENYMTELMNDDALLSLKIAFTYMPKAIEVTKYEYGDQYQNILDHIEAVRSTLLINDVDPDEVYGDINPDSSPNSSY